MAAAVASQAKAALANLMHAIPTMQEASMDVVPESDDAEGGPPLCVSDVEVGAMLKSLLATVYARPLSHEELAAILLACPEAHWIARCACLCPCPPGWQRRGDVDLGGLAAGTVSPRSLFRRDASSDSPDVGGEGEGMPPHLVLFASLLWLVLQAAREPRDVTSVSAWVQQHSEESRTEAFRQLEEWQQVADESTGRGYWFSAQKGLSTWEAPGKAHAFFAQVCDRMLDAHTLSPLRAVACCGTAAAAPSLPPPAPSSLLPGTLSAAFGLTSPSASSGRRRAKRPELRWGVDDDSTTDEEEDGSPTEDTSLPSSSPSASSMLPTPSSTSMISPAGSLLSVSAGLQPFSPRGDGQFSPSESLGSTHGTPSFGRAQSREAVYRPSRGRMCLNARLLDGDFVTPLLEECETPSQQSQRSQQRESSCSTSGASGFLSPCSTPSRASGLFRRNCQDPVLRPGSSSSSSSRPQSQRSSPETCLSAQSEASRCPSVASSAGSCFAAATPDSAAAALSFAGSMLSASQRLQHAATQALRNVQVQLAAAPGKRVAFAELETACTSAAEVAAMADTRQRETRLRLAELGAASPSQASRSSGDVSLRASSPQASEELWRCYEQLLQLQKQQDLAQQQLRDVLSRMGQDSGRKVAPAASAATVATGEAVGGDECRPASTGSTSPAPLVFRPVPRPLADVIEGLPAAGQEEKPVAAASATGVLEEAQTGNDDPPTAGEGSAIVAAPEEDVPDPHDFFEYLTEQADGAEQDDVPMTPTAKTADVAAKVDESKQGGTPNAGGLPAEQWLRSHIGGS
eukprot:TRINITY_DN9073_c0_g1_i1.p1 TRINITY_DN9073_c0_g1~~TRINITY_DN9073_c0_g1_i1.p1  ORF type:complete len:801 (+),score=216.15 TRINITY_DN9073_c0_g1_i1:62-2464(+)